MIKFEEGLWVKTENAKAALKIAEGNCKEMLLALFPQLKEETNAKRPITERVKTFDDALKELNPFRPLVKEYKALCKADVTENMIAYSRLCIVTAALNEGWTPQFVKGECRYFPYFYLYSKEDISRMSEEQKSCLEFRSFSSAYAYGGVSWSSAGYGSAYVNASVSSRFAFKTKELAEYAGKQFIDLYADYLLGY